MNTRKPIQPSSQPAVLSVAFSSSRKRFVAALATGLHCFRSDNCLTTYQPTLPQEGSVGIAEALDDRYLAYVGGGRSPTSSPNVVVFWDALRGTEVTRFDLHEPILGLRLASKWMVVALKERAVVFEYQQLRAQLPLTPPPEGDHVNDTSDKQQEPLQGPNAIRAVHPTSLNVHALACLQHSFLVLPAQSIGQVQLIFLSTSSSASSKRVLRAHNSALRSLALSPDNSLLATASEQGTLIRVFDVQTLDQKAEFRRGMDHAIIYALAFSTNNRWLACTSDKGTLHIFDLRPPATVPTPTPTDRHLHRRSQPAPTPAFHRLSGPTGLGDRDSSLSTSPSNRSSPVPTPSHQGSVQEYYGLRPPPSSASPSKASNNTQQTALQTLSNIPFAPRLLKDIRSTASAPFTIGSDPPHWQGGPAVSWTVTPNGTRKRVRNPVMPLPSEPTGKPMKGVLAFEPKKRGSEDEGEGEILWVIGGGSEALWEMFELGLTADGSWGLVRRGFRRYLTRQFVD